MKNLLECKNSENARWLLLPVAILTGLILTGVARASVAYGTVNNFDTVNDTGVPCHGFEIELDDCHSLDISYTYDYNHYGNPKITEQAVQDASLSWHTNTFVRYEAVWTNTGWSAYTAVPTNNIPPTAGHAFTNPNINFGGEHFGVGYRANPSKVYYHWLVDMGNHALSLGPQVNVSTPVFNYSPPAGGVPAQAVAVIPAPLLPVPPSPPGAAFEFSDATWVKVITTTSHTNTEVKIGDLVTPDPNDPAAKDWRNGQTNVEVETEWQLLQIDYLSSDYNPTNGVGGPNGKLTGKTRSLTNSDDVVTYRYEYYAYVGPYADLDTHQALVETVAADGLHAGGTNVLYTNDVVVGKFLGAQMSAMAASAPIGLIDHLPDGQLGVEYPWRSVVIAGDTNFTATLSGNLPGGMAFDAANGRIYGTPSESGIFVVTVTATATNNQALKKSYPFMVGADAFLPPHGSVDTAISPPDGGSTTGDNVYTNGTLATVTAAPNAGYGFRNWTENGTVVSTSASYPFTNIVNRSLVANFGPTLNCWPGQSQALTLAWLTNLSGCVLQQNSGLADTNWAIVTNTINVLGTSYQVDVPMTNGTCFFRLIKTPSAQ